MATRDFTANQIRTAKVIMTGSAASGGVGHKNIELSVYSESVAPDQLGGTPTPSPYSAAGDDVSIFISGSQTSRDGSAGGVTLFHGDTFISGTLVVKNAGRTHGSISGSIQKMADGTDYIRVTGGLTATSGSDGSVTIDGSGITGGGDASLNYYDESNDVNPFAPFAAGDQSVVIGTKSLASAGSEYTLVFGLGNTGSNTQMSNILGGMGNQIQNINASSEFSKSNTISGGEDNIITGSNSYSNIGGGKDNIITGSTATDDSAGFNTIAGGSNNRITGSQSTIGGGDQNETQSQFNTIAGGNQNKVETFSDFSFVGGGGSNISSGNSNSDNAHYAVIAGGQSNKIAATAEGSGGAPNASILGGWLNKIQNSENSSILGGKNNLIDNNDSSMLLGQHLTSSAANQTILGYGDTFGGTGYVVASGSFFKSDGLSGGAITGSITRTKDDLSYLVAGSNMTITSASNGQITLSSTGGGGSTILQTSVYSLVGGFSVVNSTDITHLKDDISTYVKELSDGTNSTVGTAIRLNNSNDIPSGFIFRTQVPAGATKIQFTINAFATGTPTDIKDFELLVSGRKFEQETGNIGVQAAADQNDTGLNRWLNTGDFGAWRGFTSSTQTANKFTMQQGPRMYIVNSREINLSDLKNSDSSAVATGDVLDIAIARNASTGTEIGTSVDTGEASQGLIIQYVRVNFKA